MKTSFTYLIFMFQMMFIFPILRRWKNVFHIYPFQSTSYVLKVFGCLEVSNRLSNWNKAKNLIFVWSILQICQLEIPLFIYKFMCMRSLWISVLYGFCEFNHVASWNKCKTIILVRSSLQICQLEILFHN